MALSDRARQYLHYSLTDLPVATEVADRVDASADSGTTSRICYRSADYALAGAVVDYYLYIQVMAVTPTGTAMASEPLLLSLDISYDSYLNR